MGPGLPLLIHETLAIDNVKACVGDVARGGELLISSLRLAQGAERVARAPPWASVYGTPKGLESRVLKLESGWALTWSHACTRKKISIAGWSAVGQSDEYAHVLA